MARISIEDTQKYKQTSFFSLADDGDVATVRIIADTVDDVELYAVHKLEDSAKNRVTVNCLRDYSDAMDLCPLCAEKHKVTVSMYLKLLDLRDEKNPSLKYWERGTTFEAKIRSIGKRNPCLASVIMDIERVGKKGDVKTSYEFFAIQTDKLDSKGVLESYNLEDIEALGTILADWTEEDMEQFLSTGLINQGVSSDNQNTVKPRERGRGRNVSTRTDRPARKEEQKRPTRRPKTDNQISDSDENEEDY